MKAAVAVTVIAGVVAAAQVAYSFPTEPIKMVVAFAPASGPDVLARLMANAMVTNFGQQVSVDNKPDPAGVTAALEVAGAPADGHTLLFASVRTWSVNPAVVRTLKYDPIKNFDPISVAVRAPYILAVSPSLSVKSVSELIEYMKANPGKVTFSSSGEGSLDHLTAALFMQETGTKGAIASSNSVFAAVNDVVDGRVQATFQSFGPLSAHVKAGKLVAIASTSEKRLRLQSDIPTFAEGGFKQLAVYFWIGIGVPKGVPRERRAKLVDGVLQTLRNPEVIKVAAQYGYEVVANTPDEFARDLSSEIARWKKLSENGN